MQQKLCHIFNSVLLKRNLIYSYSAFLSYIAQNYKVFKIITKCFKLSVSRHPLVSEPRLEAVVAKKAFLYTETKSLGFLVQTFFCDPCFTYTNRLFGKAYAKQELISFSAVRNFSRRIEVLRFRRCACV